MTDILASSKVRELQAMLFPIQPIHGSALSSIQRLQELHASELERFEFSRRETDQTLFPLPFGTTKHYHQSRDALQALLDARCVIDGITQEAARWPTECQVIPERIRHIEYNPSIPEPFYIPTGKEPKPKPIGDELGTVIFRYCPTGVTNYFNRSCVGGSTIHSHASECSAELTENYAKDKECTDTGNNVFFITESTAVTNDNTDLHFESRFESGNLGKVVKITDTYYQLHLRKDLYTQRHTQWYYFRISNTRSRTTYRLSIVNLCKEESLYNEGLRPLLYSTEDAEKRAVGWRRCGDNIAYYRNDSSSDEEKEKHTLTFNVSFPHDRDTVYLAHCYPYTYTDLQEYLARIVADPVKTRFTKLRLLCRTLAGNGVYYLTITAPTYDEEVRRKRGVVITARVHPGETPSSWTMKGIIDFLTGESNQAKDLRERFVFKLVPMLNPDGVIVGNNRCSLSGKDLNRQYRTVMRESYPSVWHTKLMIRRLLEECGVAIYCDLHAHSRKHNIFAYGCENKRGGCYARLSEQVFPLMLHKNAADKFSFENCKFHVEKGKEGTGRVVVWSMGVQNSYTMEASMGGSMIGSRSGTHFSTQDYEQFGKAFCETLLDFFDQDPTKEKLRTKIVAKLLKEGSSADEPTNIDLTDYSSDEGDTSDSSTSEKEETEFTDNAWAYEDRELVGSPKYLCVPPPSPVFVAPRSFELSERRIRKGISTGRNYLQRRKLLARRAVMDLPTTDPGSDLCDFTDSADESLARRGGSSARVIIQQEEEIVRLSDRQTEKEKEKASSERLILPEIVRPRSVSFGENLLLRKEDESTNKRSQCLRLTRKVRNPSAMSLKSQDVQIKLSSLRQQIWMGVPLNSKEDTRQNNDNPFVRGPLSWGVSKLASSQCNVDSEILLKSCSKRLQSLQHADRNEHNVTRRTKKKHKNKETISRKDLPTKVERMQNNESKSTKKKKSRLKWQRAVNLSSRIKETEKTSYLAIKADSLKLVTVDIPTKSQSKQPKLEPRRRYRKNGTVASTISNVGKTNIVKLHTQIQLSSQRRSRSQRETLIFPICESWTSDNESSDSQKHKISKKKQKKKKSQKKTKTAQATEKKKRASSAKS